MAIRLSFLFAWLLLLTSQATLTQAKGDNDAHRTSNALSGLGNGSGSTDIPRYVYLVSREEPSILRYYGGLPATVEAYPDPVSALRSWGLAQSSDDEITGTPEDSRLPRLFQVRTSRSTRRVTGRNTFTDPNAWPGPSIEPYTVPLRISGRAEVERWSDIEAQRFVQQGRRELLEFQGYRSQGPATEALPTTTEQQTNAENNAKNKARPHKETTASPNTRITTKPNKGPSPSPKQKKTKPKENQGLGADIQLQPGEQLYYRVGTTWWQSIIQDGIPASTDAALNSFNDYENLPSTSAGQQTFAPLVYNTPERAVEAWFDAGSSTRRELWDEYGAIIYVIRAADGEVSQGTAPGSVYYTQDGSWPAGHIVDHSQPMESSACKPVVPEALERMSKAQIKKMIQKSEPSKVQRFTRRLNKMRGGPPRQRTLGRPHKTMKPAQRPPKNTITNRPHDTTKPAQRPPKNTITRRPLKIFTGEQPRIVYRAVAQSIFDIAIANGILAERDSAFAYFTDYADAEPSTINVGGARIYLPCAYPTPELALSEFAADYSSGGRSIGNPNVRRLRVLPILTNAQTERRVTSTPGSETTCFVQPGGANGGGWLLGQLRSDTRIIRLHGIEETNIQGMRRMLQLMDMSQLRELLDRGVECPSVVSWVLLASAAQQPQQRPDTSRLDLLARVAEQAALPVPGDTEQVRNINACRAEVGGLASSLSRHQQPLPADRSSWDATAWNLVARCQGDVPSSAAPIGGVASEPLRPEEICESRALTVLEPVQTMFEEEIQSPAAISKEAPSGQQPERQSVIVTSSRAQLALCGSGDAASACRQEVDKRVKNLDEESKKADETASLTDRRLISGLCADHVITADSVPFPWVGALSPRPTTSEGESTTSVVEEHSDRAIVDAANRARSRAGSDEGFVDFSNNAISYICSRDIEVQEVQEVRAEEDQDVHTNNNMQHIYIASTRPRIDVERNGFPLIDDLRPYGYATGAAALSAWAASIPDTNNDGAGSSSGYNPNAANHRLYAVHVYAFSSDSARPSGNNELPGSYVSDSGLLPQQLVATSPQMLVTGAHGREQILNATPEQLEHRIRMPVDRLTSHTPGDECVRHVSSILLRPEFPSPERQNLLRRLAIHVLELQDDGSEPALTRCRGIAAGIIARSHEQPLDLTGWGLHEVCRHGPASPLDQSILQDPAISSMPESEPEPVAGASDVCQQAAREAVDEADGENQHGSQKRPFPETSAKTVCRSKKQRILESIIHTCEARVTNLAQNTEEPMDLVVRVCNDPNTVPILDPYPFPASASSVDAARGRDANAYIAAAGNAVTDLCRAAPGMVTNANEAIYHELVGDERQQQLAINEWFRFATNVMRSLGLGEWDSFYNMFDNGVARFGAQYPDLYADLLYNAPRALLLLEAIARSGRSLRDCLMPSSQSRLLFIRGSSHSRRDKTASKEAAELLCPRLHHLNRTPQQIKTGGGVGGDSSKTHSSSENDNGSSSSSDVSTSNNNDNDDSSATPVLAAFFGVVAIEAGAISFGVYAATPEGIAAMASLTAFFGSGVSIGNVAELTVDYLVSAFSDLLSGLVKACQLLARLPRLLLRPILRGIGKFLLDSTHYAYVGQATESLLLLPK